MRAEAVLFRKKLIHDRSKHNKKDLVQMAFDVDFRKEILSQLDYQITTKKSMEITKSEKKTLRSIKFCLVLLEQGKRTTQKE